MIWDLKEKVVVITRGADGIGYNIAENYLEKGAKIIIILDINEALGTEAKHRLNLKHGNNKSIFFKCDVTTDIDSVLNKIFQSYTVDILVNNAGIAIETVPKKLIDINLTAVIECSFKLWEHMRKDKGGNGGTIINISSIFGIMTHSTTAVYPASKHGVLAFTKSLGHVVNYERSGVRVVAICPGFTETQLLTTFKLWDQSQTDDFVEHMKTLPIQKVDAVGKAAVEIYQRANSGTAWKIEGAEPIADVTEQ